MKLKKILATILCVAMVLSTMSFAAFAEEQPYAEAIDTVESANFGAEEISLFSTKGVDSQEPKLVMDGDKYFASIKDAFDTLKSADKSQHTIKLLKDLDVDVNYVWYKYPILVNGFNIELDMNGKTITADWSKLTGGYEDISLVHIANGGDLVITGNGTIKNLDSGNVNTQARIFWLQNDGSTLTIQNGTFEQYDDIRMLYTQGGSKDGTSTETYINGGHFEMGGHDDFFNSYDGCKQETVISGGTFNFNPTDWELKIHPDFAPVENADGEWGVVVGVAELWRAENGAARNVDLVSVGKFATLQDAIDAIGTDEGDYVIKVLTDIEEDVTVTQNENQKITITSDTTDKPVINGTIKIDGRSARYATAGLTIENIVFDAEGINSDTIITAGWDNATRYVSNLTISNCDFVDESASKSVRAIYSSTGGSVNWLVEDCTATGLHSLIQTKAVEQGFVVEDCEITNCKNGINLNNTPSFTMTGTTIEVDGYGVRSGEATTTPGDITLTFENNTINAAKNTDDTNDSAIVLRAGTENANVEITSGTYNGAEGQSAITVLTTADVEISGGEYSSDVSAYLADGLTISVNEHGNYAVVANDAGNSSAVTEKVTVSLEPTENANKYDVVLKADENTEIHRFLSAELNITLTHDANDITPISIKNIVGNEEYGIEVIKPQYNANEIWGFHLGEATDITVKDFSGSELTIATIELTGYGEGYLTVAAHEHNKVQAIQSKDNNNVKFYTVDAATLVLPTEVTPVNLEVPTKNLTIEITFVNPIEDNYAAYQQMKVVVDGDDVEPFERELGKDIHPITVTDEIVQYIIPVDEYLTENNSYNITITGEGYRTAEYRVTMTEDKIVYFWNNATKEDNKKEIEIGVSKPVTATFLAGDIAEDNIIDKYDLAAVVSYFGKYKLNAANAEGIYEYAKYAKYDLNRDGNIDSEDIAYVLASFGY